MSEIVDITVGIIQEEITISAVNNIGEITVNAVSNSEEVNVTANTNLIQINISTAPVTIINPQDYDLSQFTNTSSNPFVQQSGLTSYVPISRTITINGISQDLSTDRSWTIPGATWGSITGTLALQTDLQTALDAKVPTSRTLTINGTSYDLSADRSWTISTGITIGSTAITSGVVGRVLFEGAGNVVLESANLFWDNTNGTLETTTTADNLFGLKLKSPTGQLRVKPYLNSTYGVLLESKNAADSAYLPMSFSSSKHLFLDGNVIINSTSDSGFKLDVNGTARLGGQVNFSTNISASTTSAFGLNYINFNALTANQGISASFAPNGTPGGYAYNFQFAKSSTVNNNSLLFIGGGASAGPATNKHLITTSTDGTATAQPLAFAVATGSWSSATPLMTLTPTQNVLIGTTADAGYKLDINGSTRLKGAGTTVATTGLLVQNSAGTTSLTCYDDLSIYIDGKNSSGFATNIRIGGQSNQATISFFGNNNIYVGQATAIENIPSALIAMGSTTKGFLLPRMTNTQVLAIATPATGLQAYDTTNNKLMVYDATAWRNIATENWVTSQGYLTTQPWVVSGSNIYYSTGNVGIGTSSPAASLQIGDGSTTTNSLYIGGSVSTTQQISFAVNNNTVYHGFTSNANSGEFRMGAGFSGGGHYLVFASGNNTERMRVLSGGNILVGTTTDAGFKFDVNGTLRATQITASSAGGSFNVGGVNVVDFGDGLRIGYSSSVTKITLLTNSGTPRFQVVNSGSILIGTTTEVTSSLLTLESTTRGFLLPRMTTTQKNAIATPATGLIVYDTTLSALSSFNGTTWSTIGGSVAWGSITGTLALQTDLQSALDAKVPYTGATANVDLGEYELKAGQLSLDITPTGTAAVGTTRWNDAIGSSETTLKGGNVVLKNGVDLVTRVVNKVTPNATLLKANYTAVRVSGAQGQRLAVEYAQADNDLNSADTLGLVIENIATNQEGFIMTVGQLLGVNTTGSLQGETWADGDVLYLSPTTPGAVTNIKPTGATGHIIVIGYVEYAHGVNGKIYVKIMNGWELDELHNVYINPATLADGDTLIYDSATSLWKNGAGGGGGGSIIKLATQTLAVGSWTLVSGYYQYTFSNASITTNTRVDFIPSNASYNEVTTCGMLPQVDVTAGSCTFYSLFPPQNDITGEITIFPTI